MIMNNLDSNLINDQVLSKKVVLKISRLSASFKVLQESQIEDDNTKSDLSINKTPKELMEVTSFKVTPISSKATHEI